MRQEYKRKMRKQMGRRYLAILCIIAIFCTSLPITTTQTQARAYTDWEVYETDTGDAIAAAYGNHTFVLLNDVGIFYTSEDALTWTQTGILPGVDGTKKYTYEKLQMKYLNDRFFVYGVNDIFLWSMDGKEWESISIGNGLVTAMTYGEGAWYVATDGADRNRYQDEGDTFSLWSSQDGESFTKLGTESDIKACNSLCFAQNKLIVTDPVSDTINTLQPDGTLLAKIDAHNVCYEHYYAESRYKSGMFLCFFEGYIWYSTDAITWNCYKMLYQFLRNSMGEWAEIRDNYYMLNKTSGELYEITPCYDQPPVFTYINCRMSYGYDIQKLVVCDDVLWGFGNNIAARMPMKFDAETIEWDDAEKTPTISDGSVSDGSISENVPALIYEEDYVRLTKDITFSEDYTLRGKKLYLDGHILTIQGDFTCGDTVIDTGQGKLYVAGNMIVDSQTKISGKLEVDGYLSIQGGSLDCEICDIVVHGDLRVYYYRYNYGLQMRHEEDHVSVSGYLGYNTDYYGLLTAGTIDAYGTVRLSAGFKSRESHILRVWGDLSQSVIINDSNCEVANYEDMRVDITPPEPVDSLLMKSATGKAVYLTWKEPKDNGKIASYKVYRNGACIKEVTETEVRIEEKYANEEATYYITAIDEAGWESAKGKEITAKAEPLAFYKVLPENGSAVGKTVTITPYMNWVPGFNDNQFRIYYHDPVADTETEVVKESLTKWKDNWFEGKYRYTKEYPIDLSKFKQEQDITVYAELTDIDGGVTAESITLHLDRTPPEQPAVTVVENEENIYLEWDKIADAKYYGIYRREENTEIYKKLAERWWNNYYDSTVQDGKTYIYAVTAIDAFENESDKTEIPAVYKHPDTQAPVLKSFRVIGEEKNREITTVRLYATDNRNVNRFVITGKRENDTENTIYEVVSGVNGYSKDVTIDTRKYEDGDYLLTAYAEDRAGNKSDEKTAKLIIDNTPPAVPAGIHAEVTCTTVRLSWDQTTEPDLKYYIVESKNEGEAYWRMLSGHNIVSSRLITGLKPEQTISYRIYAVDDVDNQSAYSDEIKVTTPPDLEAPSKTTIAVKSSSGSAVTVSWKAATDNVGVKAYRIYKNGELLTEISDKLNYRDEEVEPDQSYQYEVAAVDEAGNEAEKSNKLSCLVTLPVILNITPENGARIGKQKSEIDVTLLNYAEAGKKTITCSYYKPDTDSWELIGTTSVSPFIANTTSRIYWDTSAFLEDADIRVRVVVLDEDRNAAQQELTLHLDRTPPALPELTGSEKDAKITLTWNRSADEDCAVYQVYRKAVSGNDMEEAYRKICSVKNNGKDSYQFTDTAVLQQSTYVYYIQVQDIFGNAAQTEPIEIYVATDLTPPTPPTDVWVHTRTGSSVTLGYSGAKDNVGVAGYFVYRDGKKIAETAKPQYTDYGKDLENGLQEYVLYRYTIKAFDLAGNESEESQIREAFVKMPYITELKPADQTSIAAKETTLQVIFENTGNSSGNYADFYWTEEGKKNWQKINKEPVWQSRYGGNYLQAAMNWELPEFAGTGNKEIRIKAVLTDRDGNQAEEEVICTIDRTIPDPPKQVEAQLKEDVILLTWDFSDSADIAGYIVYRSTDAGNYDALETIEDPMCRAYMDRTVSAGHSYRYRMSAVDVYGRKSKPSDCTQALQVTEDTIAPKLTALSPDPGRVNGKLQISAEGYDNRKIDSFVFYIREDSENPWTELAKVQAENNKATCVLDTTGYEDGQYFVKAEARDCAGNVSQNLFQRRYEIDNTGIAKIKMAKCDTLASVIRLRWEDVTETDFAYFLVERKTEKDGSIFWEKVAEITDSLGYDCKNLQPQTAYTFRVAGYDDLGNRGEESDEITLTTVQDTVSPVIKRIGPVKGSYGKQIRLEIQAEDNATLDKAVFSYTTDGQEYTVLAEVRADEMESRKCFSYLWDTEKMPEGEIGVRFEVYDAAGNHNALTEEEKQVEIVYTIDHTPPQQVKKVRVTDTDGCIGLTWEESGETDIQAYRVYKKNGSSWSRIREAAVLNAYDTDVKPGNSYTYKVSAVDQAGNEGVCSEEITAVAEQDKEQPVVYGIGPADTEILGIDPVITVLAADNAGLSQIQLSYREADSGKDWIVFAELPASGRQQYKTAAMQTEELSENIRYEIKATAIDEAGNYSEAFTKNYTFDLTPPQKPELTTKPGSFRIDLQYGTADTGTELYEIYRKEYGEKEFTCVKSTTEGSYEDTTAKPGKVYYYKVRSYDENGNYSESSTEYNHASSVDTIAPVAVLPQNMTGLTGVASHLDGTGSTDNVRIKSYTWDFGDESAKQTGSKPVHTYKKAGTYTVTLTVADQAGNKNSTYGTIEVKDAEQNGKLQLSVMGSDGSPLASADLYISADESGQEAFRTKTDQNGAAELILEPGTYEMAAFTEGYLPKQEQITISKGEILQKKLYLSSGEVVEGNLTFHRMTLEEILEAGVDLSDPENLHTYTFNVTLAYAERPIPVVFNGMSAGTLKKGSSTGGGFRTYTAEGNGGSIQVICKEPEAENEEPQPQALIYVNTQQTVSWLKDMYNVQLAVINQADSGFTLSQSSATLSLPGGLSLAATKSGQTMTKEFGDIEGQECARASWIVKGDKSGSYEIRADFSANMEPFHVPIHREFVAKQDVTVSAGEGLYMIVQPDSAVFYDEESYIYFSLQNRSDHDFYNVKTTFGSTKEGAQQYVISEGTESTAVPLVREQDILDVGILRPGQSVTGMLQLGIAPSDEKHYLELVETKAEILKGENLGVTLIIAPIRNMSANHKMYVNEDGSTYYGDPVNVATGAFTQEIHAFTNSVGDSLLDLSYDSRKAAEVGEAGRGFRHSYEYHISEKQGKIVLRTQDPKEEFFEMAPYTATEELESNMAVQEKERKLEVIKCLPNYVYPGKYTSEADPHVQVVKDKDGSYLLTDSEENKWYFDKEGVLYKREDTNGQVISYERTEEALTIHNRTTDETVTLSYDTNGRLVNAGDSHGRGVSFAYDENDCLTGYRNEEGNLTTYTYDEKGRMLTVVSPMGTVLVENSYDEAGRVIRQKEAGDDRYAELTYKEPTSRVGRTEIQKRDGAARIYYYDLFEHILSETDENGAETSYVYEKGKLVKKIEPDGKSTEYTYDADGNLTKQETATGQQAQISYDTDGNPVNIASGEGTAGTYRYDEKGRISEYISALSEVRHYTYNPDGTLRSMETEGLGTESYTYDTYGNRTSVTDRLGNCTKYAYDQYGNLIKTTDALGNTSGCVYDQMGRVLSQTDARGIRTEYTYDAEGRLLTEKTNDREIHYKYDAAGRLIQKSDAAGIMTAYAYDAEGNVTETDRAGQKELSSYDAAGQLLSVSDAVSANTVYTYDKNGYVTSITENGLTTIYTNDTYGKMLKKQNPDGTVLQYTYTNDGLLSMVTDQDGNTESYVYDKAGNLTGQTDALGNRITYAYDIHGRLIRQTDARGNSESYAYDAVGNCIKRTDAMGTVTEMTYDMAGRMTEQSVLTKAGKITNHYTYDAAGNILTTTDAEGSRTVYRYDDYGNCISKTDCMGNVTEYTYDALNRQTGTSDAAGKEAYTYDAQNNLIRHRTACGSGQETEYLYTYTQDGMLKESKDPLQGISSIAYNRNRQIASVTDPLGNETVYQYDSAGRISRVRTAADTQTEYTYNAQGLLASEKTADAKTDYTYDALGRILTKVDALGRVTYTYDANSNITKVTEQQNGRTTTIKRSFDALNRVTSVTDANGKTVSYSYDELGNRISLTYPGGEIVRYSYDKCGDLLTVTEPDGSVNTYTYDKKGRCTGLKRADGTEESYSYDKADRLSAQTDKNADGTIRNSYTYTYDGAGNIIKIGGTADTAAGHAVMTYDRDNRLATYNGEKVTYDERGNMLHGPLNGEMGDYTYDCRNRLIETKAADGTVTAYTYDAENTRLTEETENTRHTFVTDKETTYSQLLTETISEKHLLTYKETATITYTYGNGLISDSRKEAKDSDTEKRYYHYNHIGSTTAITDADGDLVYRIAYGTYGELTGIYDTDGDPVEDKTAVIRSENLRFLYNGRYGVETGANGLYYMRARYYNPQIKRFINRDIIDGSITDSQSLNKYSYVQGNPISLVDPFGLCAQDYFSRAGHELLDWLGFLFDPADAINFLWYTAEGNAAMAAATAVAIVPAAGSFIAKGTKQAIKAGKKAAQKAGEKAAKNATEKAAKKAAAKKLAKEAGKEAAEKGAEKAAKEAAEKATEKTAKETAEKTAKEATEKGIKSGSKTVPNPNGKKGGVAHQSVIDDIKTDAEKRGLTYDTEYKYDTTGGYKNSRYADVVVYDSKGRVMEIHQVGRTTKRTGAPVSRERKAIRDIRSSVEYNGAKIIYHPYDR